MNINDILNKQYWLGFLKRNSRVLWALGIALLTLEIFRLIYLQESPFLGIDFLGEAIIGAVVFLLVYYFGKPFVLSIGRWLERVVGEFLRKVLYDFWRTQSTRLAEVMKRENVEDDVKPVFSSTSRAVLLDTSAIIDGRILGIINTGFMENNLIIAQNVVDELKFMADKKDALKREKGRRGLDILREIKKSAGKSRFFLVDLKSKPEKVDDSLINYCKKNKTILATVDYNLNKAAQVAGVKVLNVNKLANEVKMQLLPGEILLIKLIQQGKEDSQAVGYLEDGTMIVVKDSASHIGEHKEVIVDKVLQTSAGRMVFASLYREDFTKETNDSGDTILNGNSDGVASGRKVKGNSTGNGNRNTSGNNENGNASGSNVNEKGNGNEKVNANGKGNGNGNGNSSKSHANSNQGNEVSVSEDVTLESELSAGVGLNQD